MVIVTLARFNLAMKYEGMFGLYFNKKYKEKNRLRMPILKL